MRYPTHIILDINKSTSSHTTSNWTTSYKNFISKNETFVTTLTTLSTLKMSHKSILNSSFSTTTIKQIPHTFTKKTSFSNKPNSLL